MRQRLLVVFGIFFAFMLLGIAYLRSTAFEKRVASYLETYAHKSLGIRAEIGRMRILWRPLQLHFDDVKIYGGPEHREVFLSSKSTELQLPYSSLWSDKFVITHLLMTEALVNLDFVPRMATGERADLRVETIIIRNVLVKTKSRDVQILETRGAIDAGKLHVWNLDGKWKDLLLRSKGSIDLQQMSYKFSYDLEGDPSALSEFDPKFQLKGKVRAIGQLLGKGADYRLEGEIRAGPVTWKDSAAFQTRAKYQYQPSANPPIHLEGTWTLLPTSILKMYLPAVPDSLSNGSFQYSGTLDLWKGRSEGQAILEGERMRGKVAWSLANSAISFQESRLELGRTNFDFSGIAGADSMNLSIHASVHNWQDLAFLNPELKKIPVGMEWDGTLAGRYSNLILSGRASVKEQMASLEAKTEYDLASNQLEASFQGNADAEVLSRMGVPDLSGRIEFEGFVHGNVSRPIVRARLQSQNLQMKQISLGDVSAELKSDGKQAQLESHVPDLNTDVRAVYGFGTRMLALDAVIRDLDVSKLEPYLPKEATGLRGSISANLTASGNPSRWRDSSAAIQFEAAAFEQNEINLNLDPQSSITLRRRKIELNLKGNLEGDPVNLSGTMAAFGGQDLDLRVAARGNLALLNRVSDQVRGNGIAEIDARILGRISHPDITGTIAAGPFTLTHSSGLRFDGSRGIGRFSGGFVDAEIEGSLMETPLSLQGRFAWKDSLQSRIRTEIDSLPLSVFNPALSGSVSVELDATGKGLDPRAWIVDAKLLPSDVAINQNKVQVAEQITVRLESGSLRLEPVHVRVADKLNLEAKGSADLINRAMNAVITTQADLTLLADLFPQFQAAGALRADARITGDWSNPIINGNLFLENGTARIPGYPFLLENIQLDAPLQNNGFQIKTLQARMGGGQIRVTGGVRFPHLETDLQISASNVALNYPQDLRSQLNANLDFKGSGTDYTLGGKIDLVRSAYRRNVSPTGQLVHALLAHKQLLVAEETFADRIRLHIRVDTQEDMLIENNLALMNAQANLELQGVLTNPQLKGQIRFAPGGQIYWNNPEGAFTIVINRGSIEFSGDQESDPRFNLEAETVGMSELNAIGERQPIFCNVHLTGSMASPEMAADCDPSATQFEFMSILIGGSRLRLQTAGSLAGQQLSSLIAARFQRAISSALGLQQFTIQPLGIATETDPGARLTLTKQVTSQISATYSADLSSSTDQTWIAEYRTRNNLLVRLIDQEDNHFTASMGQRLRFGGGRSDKEKAAQDREDRRIVSVNIQNQSPISENEIRSIFNLKEGDAYQFWKVQETMDEIKSALQRHGYLYPEVTVEEREEQENRIHLTLKVDDRGKRSMRIDGYAEVDLVAYEQLWREGLSEELVLGEIRQQLESELWLKGHHRVKVSQTTEETANGIVYHFTVSPGTAYPNSTVVFEGSKIYPADQLMDAMRDLYSSQHEMFAEALQRFPEFRKRVTAIYIQGGFLRVDVTEGAVRFEGDTATKKIFVQEGPPTRVREIRLLGVKEVPSDLLQKLKMTEDAIYRPLQLREDETAIRDYFLNEGFLKVRVGSDLIHSPGSSDVIVQHNVSLGNPAYVASVTIAGKYRTRRNIVQSNIAIKEGDILRPEALQETHSDLQKLGVFDLVTVGFTETQIPDKYDVRVELHEGKKYELRYGMRYGNEDDFEGEAQLRDENMFGTTHSAFLYAKAHPDFQRYVLGYESPSIFGLNWNAFVNFSQDRTRDPFFVTSILNFQQEYHLFSSWRLLNLFKYNRVHTRLFDPLLGQIDFELAISRLIAIAFSDTRNDPFNARKGRFISTELEYSPSFLGSDSEFLKTFTQFYYYRTKSRFTWASGLRLGVGRVLGRDAKLIPQERYFAGGSGTLRGFELNSVGPLNIATNEAAGGEAVFILNQELRFLIYRWFDGAVFYDAGNVYDRFRDLDLTDLRHTLGLGLRVRAYGMIGRLDLGFNLDPERNESKSVLHFSVGQAF